MRLLDCIVSGKIINVGYQRELVFIFYLCSSRSAERRRVVAEHGSKKRASSEKKEK